jgi:hypothetical protein
MAQIIARKLKKTKSLKRRGLSIAGSNKNRETNDFYPTPKEITKALLEREHFEGSIWEPACGKGDVSEVLINAGYNNVFSSDLIDYGYGNKGDFFETDFTFDNIITNPPYKDGLAFILEAKKKSTKKIAMFLKTQFLESVSRYEMFQDEGYKLKVVYQFSKRVTLSRCGIKMRNSGMIAYAWYVWERDYAGPTELKWIR